MLKYKKHELDTYTNMLKNTGSISGLFSESKAPYLVSRSTENIYCEAFSAENLGRSDCSADANYNQIGIGIKTFLHLNGKTLQKVAEFNKQIEKYKNKTPKELIYQVAQLRNERIRFTMQAHNLTHMIYHCITRAEGKIYIFEEPMDLINIKNIKNIVAKKTTISFEDDLHEYSFNITKSTLYKRFKLYSLTPICVIDVEVFEQPYLLLEQIQKYIHENNVQLTGNNKPDLSFEDLPTVVLPLFSDRGERHVPERSGLNQWNANGRKRDVDEIYIPIPAWIHKNFPEFFPEKDKSFEMKIPNGRYLNVKLCQQGRKALMSNPNKDLGKWLLREVFNLKENELLTYHNLEMAGIDSVRVTKVNENQYAIDFCNIGTYDEFVEENAE